MRPFAVTLILLVVCSAGAIRPAYAAGLPPRDAVTSAAAQSTPKPVDSHDGSRVGVQLVVAGVALGLVVGVGSAAYLLRRRLGLTAYSADEAAGGHH